MPHNPTLVVIFEGFFSFFLLLLSFLEIRNVMGISAAPFMTVAVAMLMRSSRIRGAEIAAQNAQIRAGTKPEEGVWPPAPRNP